ncbi:hypothetical protein LCGC14_0406440 [marine sediment metagenome]|uniref:Uncharacterized protein n=1 Tax=marine sediment metagenome TaxID=412755 RepID=A0A0F9SVD7_9ZZZZ
MHLLDANAWCTECDWKTEGKNAMGVAAIHHKKKGHFTMVELYYSQTFGEPRWDEDGHIKVGAMK